MWYASGATTQSRLAIGAINGAILVSNGSNAPSWLTTLPAGITFSSGVTVSSGSIIFTGFSGVVKASAGTLSAAAITNSDLSGTAGITNANLANSTIAVSGGTNISVSGSPVSLGGTVTISSLGGFIWSASQNTTSPISVSGNYGYFANNASSGTAIVYNLPVPTVGMMCRFIACGNTGGFQVVASAGVTIRLLNIVSAAAGSASSTSAYDSIEMVATSTTTWQIFSAVGDISIV